MSLSTRNPHAVCGANVNSGFVNTREQGYKTGGELKAAVYSGGLGGSTLTNTFNLVAVTGDQVQLVSGPGRLKMIVCHGMVSGVAGHIYDAAVAARSGPGTYRESGLPVLAVVPANSFGNPFGNGPTQIVTDVPFHSGLFAENTSGVVGFTVFWVPETNPQDRETRG